MLIYLTKKKLIDLKEEYGKLITKRRETVMHVTKAREMGDLSENGYYKSAKAELGSIDYNLRRISRLIRLAKIIKASKRNIIALGSSVSLEHEGKIVKYLIVGKEEANPSEAKISNESPLGSKLIGKKTGDTVYLEKSSKTSFYKVIEIN